MSDEELIKKLAISPEQGVLFIYQRYSGPLFRFIFRFTGNQESAEEILHDVFAELLSAKFTQQPEGTLKSWLYTVAKNRSLNFNKKRSYLVFSEEKVAAAEAQADLEDQTIQNSLLQNLAIAEKNLPLELLETWKLKKLGFDHCAISKQLSIPVGTVKSRFHRLVEILRKEIT